MSLLAAVVQRVDQVASAMYKGTLQLKRPDCTGATPVLFTIDKLVLVQELKGLRDPADVAP